MDVDAQELLNAIVDKQEPKDKSAKDTVIEPSTAASTAAQQPSFSFNNTSSYKKRIEEMQSLITALGTLSLVLLLVIDCGRAWISVHLDAAAEAIDWNDNSAHMRACHVIDECTSHVLHIDASMCNC